MARFLRDFTTGYYSSPLTIRVDQGIVEQSEGIIDLYLLCLRPHAPIMLGGTAHQGRTREISGQIYLFVGISAAAAVVTFAASRCPSQSAREN